MLGICNGFQIACEAGLLPGALLRNANLQFVSDTVRIRVENADTMFTTRCEVGDMLRIPIAHGDGRFTADAETLDRLEGEGRVVFRYVNEHGVPECERQSERLDARHRWNRQRRRKRARPHATPRARD